MSELPRRLRRGIQKPERKTSRGKPRGIRPDEIEWCWTIHRHIINRGNTICFDEKVGKHQKGKKRVPGTKTLMLNVVYMGTIATLNWHKEVIFAGYVVMSPVGATPVVPAPDKRQAYCKGNRSRLVCCSSPRRGMSTRGRHRVVGQPRHRQRPA